MDEQPIDDDPRIDCAGHVVFIFLPGNHHHLFRLVIVSDCILTHISGSSVKLLWDNSVENKLDSYM